MHGNPLLRVLALAVLLAAAGLAVSAVARHPKEPTRPGPGADPPTGANLVPCLLTVQLSAPAKSLSLATIDGTNLVAPQRPEDLSPEFRVDLPVSNLETTVLLTVEWEQSSPHRFLRLLLEPEQLESRERIEHAPVDLKNHAITFRWPEPDDVADP